MYIFSFWYNIFSFWYYIFSFWYNIFSPGCQTSFPTLLRFQKAVELPKPSNCPFLLGGSQLVVSGCQVKGHDDRSQLVSQLVSSQGARWPKRHQQEKPVTSPPPPVDSPDKHIHGKTWRWQHIAGIARIAKFKFILTALSLLASQTIQNTQICTQYTREIETRFCETCRSKIEILELVVMINTWLSSVKALPPFWGMKGKRLDWRAWISPAFIRHFLELDWSNLWVTLVHGCKLHTWQISANTA